MFKAEDFTKVGHWDYLPDTVRGQLLKSAGLPLQYINDDWMAIPNPIKPLIKDASTGAVVSTADANTRTGSDNSATLRQGYGRSYKEPNT